MHPDLRDDLLTTRSVGAFLRALRGKKTLQEVADQVGPLGGPQTRGAVSNHENGKRNLTPSVQRAYASAFGFVKDHRLRTHLQDLVTESTRRPRSSRQTIAVAG